MNKYPVYHKGEDGCGKVAMFTTLENPQPGDVIAFKDFTKIDGSPFHHADRIICGACHRIMTVRIGWIDYARPDA